MSTVDNTTNPTLDLSAALQRQRRAFRAEGPPDAATRRNRIDRLTALVLDNTDAYVDALVRDFGTRSPTGTLFTEIMGILSVIEHTRSHTAAWMRSTNPTPTGRAYGIRARVQPTPLGVVGIIGPWNFPLNLVVLPAVAAFAAGNRVMIKMSEITGHTAALTASLAPQYFDPAELTVVTGGADVAAAFSELPFDHLFFTGSPRVGRLVQRAAADNLVPVTLELGGKNPVVVGPHADIQRSAARIARGRMVNGGQVCVCPDYVMVPAEKMDTFLATARTTLHEMYPTMIGNSDYTSCVDSANYERVLALLDDARAHGAEIESIVAQGETLPDSNTRKIAPTLVRGVTEDMRIASEEVFGPVLTVVPYQRLDEAIAHINERPSPLVAYWFGPADHDFGTFVQHTRSGGVARNEFAIQMLPNNAPFGGVGQSGMGAYHGKAGFDTFSHQRTIVGTDLPVPITGSAAPPYPSLLHRGLTVALGLARKRTQWRLRGRRRTTNNQS